MWCRSYESNMKFSFVGTYSSWYLIPIRVCKIHIFDTLSIHFLQSLRPVTIESLSCVWTLNSLVMLVVSVATSWITLLYSLVKPCSLVQMNHMPTLMAVSYLSWPLQLKLKTKMYQILPENHDIMLVGILSEIKQTGQIPLKYRWNGRLLFF